MSSGYFIPVRKGFISNTIKSGVRSLETGVWISAYFLTNYKLQVPYSSLQTSNSYLTASLTICLYKIQQPLRVHLALQKIILRLMETL
jgi:hypothetical protein